MPYTPPLLHPPSASEHDAWGALHPWDISRSRDRLGCSPRTESDPQGWRESRRAAQRVDADWNLPGSSSALLCVSLEDNEL